MDDVRVYGCMVTPYGLINEDAPVVPHGFFGRCGGGTV
jgi:hypothetical protein